MVIKDERKKEKKFKDVGVGDVIRLTNDVFDGFTFMVITDCHEENGDHVNLACLDDGTLYYAEENETVEILNTKLIITR